MGYRTNFNLTIYDKKYEEVNESLEIMNKIEVEFGLRLSDGYGSKWDDHLKDMITFSKSYPDYYFYFSNKGDEQDDIWISFFHNGKSHIESLEPQYPTLNEVISKLV